MGDSIYCLSTQTHLGCHFVAAEHVVQDPVCRFVFDAADVHDSFGGADVWDAEGACPKHSVGTVDANILVLNFRVGHLGTTTIFYIACQTSRYEPYRPVESG